MLEIELENATVRWALKHRFLAPKVKFAEAGYPDRLFISPYGHTLFIEFKRPGNVAYPLQEYRLKQLNDRFVPALWVDTYVEAIRVLEACLEPDDLSAEGSEASVGTSVRRVIHGPWPRKDVDSSSGPEDPIPEGTNQTSPSGSSDPGDVPDLAG